MLASISVTMVTQLRRFCCAFDSLITQFFWSGLFELQIDPVLKPNEIQSTLFPPANELVGR